MLKIVAVDSTNGTDDTTVTGWSPEANFATEMLASCICEETSWPVIFAALIAEICESDNEPVICDAAKLAI